MQSFLRPVTVFEWLIKKAIAEGRILHDEQVIWTSYTEFPYFDSDHTSGILSEKCHFMEGARNVGRDPVSHDYSCGGWALRINRKRERENRNMSRISYYIYTLRLWHCAITLKHNRGEWESAGKQLLSIENHLNRHRRWVIYRRETFVRAE